MSSKSTQTERPRLVRPSWSCRTNSRSAREYEMNAWLPARSAVSPGAAARVAGATLARGGEVARENARVRFRVAQANGRRCDVLTLNLAPLTLELLGVRVQTSEINLEIYGRRGALLGDLVCALSRARIRLPRVAAALNRRLDDRPLRVLGTSSEIRAADHQGVCQVLRLVLGPLHLDLLGLNVDLFGENRRSPVTVTITALPGHGVLGDLLCGLAGGPTPAAPLAPAPGP